MSRGHSPPRVQFGRRFLEKCKAKGNVEVIDLDKGKIDVVIIKEPGTSHQGSKVSKTTRRNCYPDDVISIDDEEGDTDDTLKHLPSDAINNSSRPASSNSPTSQESQSDECLISAKGTTPFKPVDRMRMYQNASSSRNRFGLGYDYGSSTSESDSCELDYSQSSESDSSDCELMEDSSGNIREQWERAALRKKMSEKGHFGVEVQSSAPPSSGDSGLLSEEGIQNKVDVANCSSKPPAESSPFKRSNETENLSFNMPPATEFNDTLVKTKASTSIAEAGTSDGIHLEEAGLQKEEHNSESCTGKAQAMDEIYVHCKLVGFEGLEKLLRHPLCPSDLRHKFCFKDGAIFLLDKDMQFPVEISLATDTIRLQDYINKAFADYKGRISTCKTDFTSSVAELINLFSKVGRNSSSDTGHTADVLPEESGFQKDKHTIETCRHETQLPEEAFSYNKRARSQYLEDLLQHHSCPSEGRCNIDIKDAEACTTAATELSESLLKTKADICVPETDPSTDIPHEEPGFQKKEHISEAPHSGKSSSCISQPSDGKQDPPDSLGFQDKEEVPGENSSITKSQVGSVVSPEVPHSQNKENLDFETTSFCNSQPSKKLVHSVDAEATHGESTCNSQTESTTAAEQNHIPLHSDLICERERHKESDEYRRAVEEEWAARHKQLQIQAEEAQRLRRKRKAETLRLLDMERRQKERLEEIRELQKKDKETINLKEILRAEVRKELDRMEHIYRDMASLLRALGIPVAGGPNPLTREVNAAYKQALLRFHPDRASRTNIRQQVEAEEKFKLISRLKEKLKL